MKSASSTDVNKNDESTNTHLDSVMPRDGLAITAAQDHSLSLGPAAIARFFVSIFIADP